MTNWIKTNDHYNREVVTQDVWSRKCRRGKIYVIDKAPFTYTFSCGANSDYSMTGCFFGCTKIATVEQAMKAIDRIAPVWLNGKGFQHITKEYE
ncbi:hypothetical protein IR083_07850 [Dysgonomonas sp. GY75]|uniref:hypothetical protein n=1 Tax=Dysgonomonas sp. GY75 TaxID=2780419 RepID=UPI001883AEFD|nr:hypothetical protein [Dysgonomonas sp. GY75]MBF0648730.1 hypothetical protein [Dysgonomonas sp. GY75]